MAGFTDGIERRVDYATVNGRLFVNNASLGIYATVVQQDEYRDAKASTFATLLPELLGPDAEPFDLQFSEPGGRDVDGAFLIMVSNNPYVIGTSFDNFQRRSMDSGRLGVVAIDAPGPAEAARLVTASAAGLRRQSRYWHEFTCAEFEIGSRSGRAYVGVDGEALDMETPLRFTSHPRGLRMLVPSGNLGVAEQRRARGVRVADLADAALGRSRDGAKLDRASEVRQHEHGRATTHANPFEKDRPAGYEDDTSSGYPYIHPEHLGDAAHLAIDADDVASFVDHYGDESKDVEGGQRAP
jgi:hypothetical protein